MIRVRNILFSGAAPIATLNLQHSGDSGEIPDAWHHQMIFGVSQAGIYLTNPLECSPEQVCTINRVTLSRLTMRYNTTSTDFIFIFAT